MQFDLLGFLSCQCDAIWSVGVCYLSRWCSLICLGFLLAKVVQFDLLGFLTCRGNVARSSAGVSWCQVDAVWLSADVSQLSN